jgi:hypothetical protein
MWAWRVSSGLFLLVVLLLCLGEVAAVGEVVVRNDLETTSLSFKVLARKGLGRRSQAKLGD